MKTKVEILHKETIKPSSPTPQNLKFHKLSLLDQFAPTIYVPLILFYSVKDGDKDRHEKSLKLKTSLSETLTHFYPFAGRLKDNFFIDCDDQGAEFIEARIDCSLSELLEKPYPETLSEFLPQAVGSGPEAATDYLLFVQTTWFSCDGLAIGIRVSHKIVDAATLTTFIKCWSAISAENHPVTPAFTGSSIFPPLDSLSIPIGPTQQRKDKCITKRFVFDGTKIDDLRAKSASTRVSNPTRVEAVSGLLWKTLLNFKLVRSSIWVTFVNMRSRLDPPLPENYAGTCLGFIVPKMDEAKDIELKGLVGRIRKEKEEFGENFVAKIQGPGGVLSAYRMGEDFGKMEMSSEIELYKCTSWCRFDLYGADFGWRKPIWVSIASISLKNVGFLIDTRDGDGIEAWLNLSEEDMALFESNEELLQFAHVNPSVTI